MMTCVHEELGKLIYVIFAEITLLVAVDSCIIIISLGVYSGSGFGGQPYLLFEKNYLNLLGVLRKNPKTP